MGGTSPGILFEGQLDERAGLGSGNSNTFFFTDSLCSFREAATNGPVDWNGDGVAGDAASVIADLNPADHPALPCGSISDELFRGHVDWGPAPGQSIFTYRFQCTPFSADGASVVGRQLPSASHTWWTGTELTPAMAAERHAVYPPRSIGVVSTPACSFAILREEDLDVDQVDISSLRLQGAKPVATSVRDINSDGRPDLLVQFDMAEIKANPEARSIRISGWLRNSQAFTGEYELRVLPNLASEDSSCR